jgi:hypothetical protein
LLNGSIGGMTEEKYVSWVGENSIRIVCKDSETRKQLARLGGKIGFFFSDKVTFLYYSEQQLAQLFDALRGLSFRFVGGNGWPSAAVFSELREKGLLTGKFVEVVWTQKEHCVETEK